MFGNPSKYNSFDDPREGTPYRAEGDVGEVTAWCDNCREERHFLKHNLDVSEQEMRSEMPDVNQAMTGEEGYVCEVCGTFRRDIPAEEGYDLARTKLGYPVSQYPDHRDIRVAGQKGVRPPERAADVGPPPEEWEIQESGPKKPHGQKSDDR